MGVGGDGDKTEIDQLSLEPFSSLPMSSPNLIKSQGRGGGTALRAVKPILNLKRRKGGGNGPSGRQAHFKFKAREGGRRWRSRD